MQLDDATWARARARVLAYRIDHGVARGARRYPMTQDILAGRANISPGCLRGFENGTRRTTRATMERIAKGCDLTFDELIAPDAADDPVVPAFDADRIGLTDEAIAVARMFAIAHTEIRLRVLLILRDHFVNRTDRVGKALAQHVMPAVAPPAGSVVPTPITLATVLGEVAQVRDESTYREILNVIARIHVGHAHSA